MRNKLVNLLVLFDEKDMRQAKDFVGSPFFNKNSQLQILFEALNKSHPEFSISKERVFEQVFHNKKYNDLKFRQTCSALYKLLEEFLSIQKFQDNKSEKDLLLLSSLNELGDKSLFEKTDNRIAEQFVNHKTTDTDTHYHSFKYTLLKEDFAQNHLGRRKSTELQSVANYLDEYYVIQKLKNACAMLSYQNIYKQEYDYLFFDELLQYLEKKPPANPLIKLYLAGYWCIKENENQNRFEDLKDLLKSTSNIAVSELQHLHAIARNFCIKQVNTGNTDFFKYLFDLYRIGLKDEILQDQEGYISSAAFKNILTVALKVEEYNWALQFIEHEIDLLKQAYRESFYNYGLGKIHFQKEEFDKVIQRLSKVEYVDDFVMLDSKTLLLKTFYELDERESLNALLMSFNQLLERKRLLSYHKENYKNLVRYTRQMMNLPPYNQKRRKALIEKVKSAKILTEREWLLENLSA